MPELEKIVKDVLGPEYKIVLVDLPGTFTNCIPAIKRRGWFKPILLELLPLNGKISPLVRKPEGEELLDKLKSYIGEDKFYLENK